MLLIGAGLGRTGTLSLKQALERLLDAPCHHMLEVFVDPAQRPIWHEALRGNHPDWPTFLGGYEAIVDWPGAAFWRELAAAFPDAPVLLSTRASAEVWFTSASNTIFASLNQTPLEQQEFAGDLFRQLTPRWPDPEATMAAYDAHVAAVRAEIPAERLFEYQPGDGWGPLCAALGLEVPDEPFPHTNTTSEFRDVAGMDPLS